LAAGTIERVAALDAHRFDVDEDIARAHRGIGHVLVSEHARRPGLVVHGGLQAWRSPSAAAPVGSAKIHCCLPLSPATEILLSLKCIAGSLTIREPAARARS